MAGFQKTRSTQEAIVQWSLTSADPTGDLCDVPGFRLVSVQVTGALGGGTLAIEGCNDEAGALTPVQLNDQLNNAASLSATGAMFFRSAMKFIRPNLSGSTGATVVVYAHYRRQI